jgi:hypothetical protein
VSLFDLKRLLFFYFLLLWLLSVLNLALPDCFVVFKYSCLFTGIPTEYMRFVGRYKNTPNSIYSILVVFIINSKYIMVGNVMCIYAT